MPLAARDVANRLLGITQWPSRKSALRSSIVGTPRRCISRSTRECQGRPGRMRLAADWDRTVLAVQRTVKVDVGFEPAKERQHALPSPPGSARPLPGLVIVGYAAQRPHSHHGRTAAEDAALRQRHRDSAVRVLPMNARVGPHITLVEGRQGKHAAYVGGFVTRDQIGARFEQQDPQFWPRRKPVREHAAGSAGTDNDDVVLHAYARTVVSVRQPTTARGTARRWYGLPVLTTYTCPPRSA